MITAEARSGIDEHQAVLGLMKNTVQERNPIKSADNRRLLDACPVLCTTFVNRWMWKIRAVAKTTSIPTAASVTIAMAAEAS